MSIRLAQPYESTLSLLPIVQSAPMHSPGNHKKLSRQDSLLLRARKSSWTENTARRQRERAPSLEVLPHYSDPVAPILPLRCVQFPNRLLHAKGVREKRAD